ncbi:MAG: helix-hairpin-helix domain-containing protein [Acidobacteria bacterium]|nr:helix-hairpin-helix domain-containing protein [Acidobacteriota bacterium]
MTRRLATALLVLLLAPLPLLAAQSGPSGSTPPAAPAPVNINTASQAQLETLPGVGARTAERIIEYRQKNGAFRKIEDLMNVQGIGERSFLRIRPLVSVAASRAEAGGPGQ